MYQPVSQSDETIRLRTSQNLMGLEVFCIYCCRINSSFHKSLFILHLLAISSYRVTFPGSIHRYQTALHTKDYSCQNRVSDQEWGVISQKLSIRRIRVPLGLHGCTNMYTTGFNSTLPLLCCCNKDCVTIRIGFVVVFVHRQTTQNFTVFIEERQDNICSSSRLDIFPSTQEG